MRTRPREDIAEPLMRVVAEAERRPPAAPGDTSGGDKFVAEVMAAKREMNARVAVQNRVENESAWRR
jgi:hypothetical protein